MIRLMLALLPLAVPPQPCPVTAPVGGVIAAPFHPLPPYAGHWGVDLTAEPDEQVVAPLSGTVTFVGNVAGVRSMTIAAGHGTLAVTVSHLGSTIPSRGDAVRRGTPVATASGGHGGSVHLSVRVQGEYVDPIRLLRCAFRDPSPAVRLVPRSLCWHRCDAGSLAAPSIRPIWHISSPVRLPIVSSASTW